MKTSKFFLALMIALPVMGFTVFKTTAASAVTPADEETEKIYKTKCAACHKSDSSRFFDTSKSDEHHVNAILKGQKGEKPPYMPGYETKGITAEQAQALVDHMRALAQPSEPESNTDTDT